MECNKDEAAKAKEIAEKKFLAKDLAGAKRFALKAQNLYPGLEGVLQMVATLDVYISAEKKINGEPDWYGILGVDPKADDDTVRKQYRKLALMLHPDKNKSVGADGAFKLISEAWSLLSDKSKRAVHDQKRKNSKVSSQKATNPAGGPSTTAGSGGFYNFAKSSAKAHKSTPRTGHSSTPVASQKSKPNTFWTVCHRCKMQYEYLRVYLNHNLLCPNCHEPFLAVETAPPPSNGSKTSTTWNFSQPRQGSNHHAASKNTSNSASNNVPPPNAGSVRTDSYSQTNFQWGPFSRAGGASSVAQAATVVQQAYEKVKREREEAQAATKREEALKKKNNVSKRTGGVSSGGYSNSAKRRRTMEDVGLSNYENNATNQMAAGGATTSDISGSKKGNFGTGSVSGVTQPCGTRDVSQFGIQTLLMEKARKEISQKLNEWNSATATLSSVKNEKSSVKENYGGETSEGKPEMCDQNKFAQQLDPDNGIHGIKLSSGSSSTKADLDTSETMSIDVPDPDFHNFDKDRTENCFEENQVWAAYDGDDGMPRYYAMVHKVISLNPFKMRISWLNSKTNTELGPLNWVGSGFSKTCGEFRVGRYEVYNSLNSFSHKVKWTKGSRGVICIYPKKGDVWALYRNWSPEWNELTEDEVIHKYDMVEVLEDYREELGVTVAPLVKVAGFKTVFHQHLDPGEIRCIPKEEMFRFSHHVPSYLLTGQEGPNAPKGCRELDPAATPLELLQVIIDVKEEEILVEGAKQEKR